MFLFLVRVFVVFFGVLIGFLERELRGNVIEVLRLYVRVFRYWFWEVVLGFRYIGGKLFLGGGL